MMQQHIFAVAVVLAGVLGLTGCSEREQATDDPSYVLPTLHWAAQFSVVPAIEKIIASGVDVDVRNSAAQTPLHLAARFGNAKTVAALLSAGVDINAKDQHGIMPLQVTL